METFFAALTLIPFLESRGLPFDGEASLIVPMSPMDDLFEQPQPRGSSVVSKISRPSLYQKSVPPASGSTNEYFYQADLEESQKPNPNIFYMHSEIRQVFDDSGSNHNDNMFFSNDPEPTNSAKTAKYQLNSIPTFHDDRRSPIPDLETDMYFMGAWNDDKSSQSQPVARNLPSVTDQYIHDEN